jgi:hypothetical protein
VIIEVYRGLGTREGAPVIEPLLSDDALIQRGTAEMDANAHAFNRVEMDVVFRPGIRLGDLVEASDPSTASVYRAKVTGIQITVSEAAIEMRLNLEQPR